MPPEAHLSHFNLKLNGAQASREAVDAVMECVVENNLHLPDLCTLRIFDAGFKWLDADAFREGTRVQVLYGEEGEKLESIFIGEVTGLEMDLAAHGVPTLVVRCYDRSHRLQRGRYNRSFVQVTDTDIVKRIGEQVGF